MSDLHDQLSQLMRERILLMDGAMGTMVQARGLEESDFRGERFAQHPSDLKGNNELLSITRPDVIRDIHDAFLEAGCDVVETNTFGSNAIAQADYGLEALVSSRTSPRPGSRGKPPTPSAQRPRISRVS